MQPDRNGSAFRPWKVAPTPFNQNSGPFTLDVMEVTDHGTVFVRLLKGLIEIPSMNFVKAYVPSPDCLN